MLHFFWFGYTMTTHCLDQYEFSNYEIAKWAEYFLGEKVAFHQTNCRAGKVTESPKDILLGHPTWDGRSPHQRTLMGELIHNWVRDNALFSAEISHPNTYILMPWVSEFPDLWIANMPFYKSQLKAARKIFGLGGQIWIDKMHQADDQAIQSIVKDQVVHCNMGVACENFPVIKQTFNSVGERQILHMSNLANYKGFDITCASLQGLDTLLHVATNSIQAEPGLVEFQINNEIYIFNYIGYVDNNDLTFSQWVVENCDFYIHTGRMDAQATTILENCARGLVPLVTPESGFSSPHAIYLTHDPSENRQIIDYALNLPEAELLHRSQRVREQVSRENNWKDIFDLIWQEIQSDLVERSQPQSTNQLEWSY